ncbi:MAG: exo-alpha-sialidase [Planctomycetes bacterium]|nr:exo-alpha-sialidase [Planctomycetota bacterium]
MSGLPIGAGAATLALLVGAITAQTPCGDVHYGTATAGSGRLAPTIATTGGLPAVGNASFALRADATLGGAVVGEILGLAAVVRPVAGIDLLVDPLVLTTALASGTGPGAGQAVFPLPIPNDPGLVGVRLLAQMVTADPGAPQGLAASDGLQFRPCLDNRLCATSAWQGPAGSDAFSAIAWLGNDRIIAGKRSSQAADRFLLSDDAGRSWRVIGCPGSTGSHTYFFGRNGTTVLSGTGDTGNACLMRSLDRGITWSIALSGAQLRGLTGSANVLAVFGPVHLGAGHWLANLKCTDTRTKLIASTDDGATWTAPSAQPGQGPSSWARQMILTGDGVLLWPSCLTDRMYRSDDKGATWTHAIVPGASLFQPLCDAGGGVYLCGDATASPNTAIGLHRSLDRGRTWQTVTTVNLQRPTATYWRDVIAVDGTLLASACCHEGTSTERYMQLFRSFDSGTTWCSYGNPFQGPYGGMQAIYQMCVTDAGIVFAACQPDATILRWPIETAP